ncbi:MAG: hypothetical protein R3A46_21485 [Thermomicrobiales bacterium]
MTAATATTTRRLEAEQLTGMGFSEEQVSMLQRLRNSYSAFSEQFETEREFQQVQFLKWRYERGEVERG